MSGIARACVLRELDQRALRRRDTCRGRRLAWRNGQGPRADTAKARRAVLDLSAAACSRQRRRGRVALDLAKHGRSEPATARRETGERALALQRESSALRARTTHEPCHDLAVQAPGGEQRGLHRQRQ
jgi:hypothetical protein